MSENIIIDHTVTLISWENERITVPFEILKSSQFFQNLPELDQEIKLEMLEINTFTLNKIIEFLRIKEPIPKISKPVGLALSTLFLEESEFFNFFKNLDREELFLLILAAHKLDIKNLQKLCSAFIAHLFAGITPDELNSEFSIDEITIDEEDYLKYQSLNYKKT